MYLQHFGLKFDPLGKTSPTKLEQSRTLEKKLNGIIKDEVRQIVIILTIWSAEWESNIDTSLRLTEYR